MPKLNLTIDADRLTVDDLIAIDEGMTAKPRWVRDLLARFVVDDAGAFIEYEDAKRQIGKLTIPELNTAMEQFSQTVKTLQAGAVNPPTPAA